MMIDSALNLEHKIIPSEKMLQTNSISVTMLLLVMVHGIACSYHVYVR